MMLFFLGFLFVCLVFLFKGYELYKFFKDAGLHNTNSQNRLTRHRRGSESSLGSQSSPESSFYSSGSQSRSESSFCSSDSSSSDSCSSD